MEVTPVTIQELKDLVASDNFHHATYRELNTIWEGLYIYANDPDPKWVGYRLVGSFNKSEGAIADEAYDIVRHTGVSLGSRGNG
jgi:hypothetical protein